MALVTSGSMKKRHKSASCGCGSAEPCGRLAAGAAGGFALEVGVDDDSGMEWFVGSDLVGAGAAASTAGAAKLGSGATSSGGGGGATRVAGATSLGGGGGATRVAGATSLGGGGGLLAIPIALAGAMPGLDLCCGAFALGVGGGHLTQAFGLPAAIGIGTVGCSTGCASATGDAAAWAACCPDLALGDCVGEVCELFGSDGTAVDASSVCSCFTVGLIRMCEGVWLSPMRALALGRDAPILSPISRLVGTHGHVFAAVQGGGLLAFFTVSFSKVNVRFVGRC